MTRQLNIIEQFCGDIIFFFLQEIIFSTILFVIIYSMVFILRKKSSYIHFGLWSLLFIRLILPPDISFQFSARNLIFDSPILKIEQKIPETVSNLGLFNPSIKSKHKHRNTSQSVKPKLIYPLLCLVLLLGSISFFTIFIRKIFRFRLLITNASKVDNPSITSTVRLWKKTLNVRRTVSVVASDKYSLPFTVGTIRPKIYIPKPVLSTMNPGTIESIIAHEMVHIKRFDDIMIKFQNIIQIIYFFHPLIWIANSRINNAREKICDEVVLSHKIITPKTYGYGLLDVLKLNAFSSVAEPQTGFGNYKKTIQNRIKALTKGGKMKNTHSKLILLITALIGLFILPMAGKTTAPNIAETINSESNEILESKPDSAMIKRDTKLTLTQPMDGWVTSYFGPRINPFTNKKEFHSGIDIANRQGTPIITPLNGIVVEAGDRNDHGKVVLISHPSGLQTYYSHCKNLRVKKGQRVNTGDVIALCGNTGLSTGPHLHFELRINQEPVDPQKYFKIKYGDKL